MRILIAAKYMPTGPNPIGGVQSWCATVADELKRIGHDVELWQPGFDRPEGRFGFGILANWMHTEGVSGLCDRFVAMSHGIIPEERPPSGWDVVFTSEGVRDHWRMDGRIIRQPINLGFWSGPGSRDRRGLVRYSYRSGLSWLSDVAADIGMSFTHARNFSHAKARVLLSSAACVLASGRAALEAMACGAPVVICDHRSTYQGALMDLDTRGAMTRNYSGRGGIEPTRQNVRDAVTAAMLRGGDVDHVRTHHDARRIVKELLQ